MEKYKLFLLLFLTPYILCAQFSGSGTGTLNDPYLITSAEELFEVRNELGGHYKLMNDIDLTNWIQEDSPTQGWSPIGNAQSPFTGTFDGNSHSIKGLYINRNTDNCGLFGYTNGATIKNTAIIAPEITGANNVGCITGYVSGETVIKNNIVIKGSVTGKNNIGGIAGYNCAPQITKSGDKTHVSITGNYSSSSITATEGCGGGIIGFAIGSSYMQSVYNTYFHYLCIDNNAFYGEVSATQHAGGIAGKADIAELCRNICKGNVNGENSVNGICYRLSGSNVGSIDKNVFCGNSLSSKGTDIHRISNNATVNNYAYNGTIISSNGKTITVEDNESHGIAHGLNALRKQTTYEGLDFDFTESWSIVNGETFPYMITQSTPIKAPSFTAGSKGVISGTASGNGKVYVIRGNAVYEAPIVDNRWSVQLGNVTGGETVDVCVHYEGKQPSTATTVTAEEVHVAPTTNSGDANGDGTVDTADVVAIVNCILGKESPSFVKGNADVNKDGEVLIDDAVLTVQMILDAQ